MARSAGHFFVCIPSRPATVSQRRWALTRTTRCGLAKLQTVIAAASSTAADPDEGRTRGTHSLAGKSCAALELIGHTPRRSKPAVINACRHTAVELTSFLSLALEDGDSSALCLRRQGKCLAASQHGPGHAGVLGRDGDDRSPVPPPLSQGQCPLADRVGLVLGRRKYGLCT